MNGDFSRLTFDHRNHYSAVLQQQGRVGTDADWNNLVETVLRRLAIETVDVIGKCGRPKDPATGGFIVSVPAGPKIEFSKGRFYAGGRLAENEAQRDINRQLDWPVWQKAEWEAAFGAGNWPGFDPAQITAPRRDLVYLEVWDRHITALNEEALRETSNRAADFPDAPVDASWIRERALGGPDTCTRLRTVAQVKLYANIGNVADCDAACAKLGTDRPSKTRGTMRVFVVSTPPVNTPCEVPQTGGYGGAENRLYRIQIHAPGAAGVATFKWSTENGAFAVRVIETSKTSVPAGTAITVQTLGNDQQTQLHKGDWVEMCGEETELGGFRNALAQITDDPASKPDGMFTVKLSRAATIPSAPFLRRWDGDTGTIALDTEFKLDDGSGLSVRFFSETGATTGPQFFHDLDYWTFSARVATRDIEPQALVSAPQPVRGIHRHYCCLALIDWNAAGSTGPSLRQLTNCDHEFPPLTDLPKQGGDCCCCTIVVDKDDRNGHFTTIETALAAMPPWVDETTPGVILCIQPGIYELREPARVVRNKVIIRGCGPDTVIRVPNGGLLIEQVTQIAVSGIRFEQILDGPAIRVLAGREILIRDNTFVVQHRGAEACAIHGNALHVENNLFLGVPDAREASSGLNVVCGSQAVFVTGNSFGPNLGVGVVVVPGPGGVGTVTSLSIERNSFQGLTAGAIFSGLIARVRDVSIASNRMTGNGGVDQTQGITAGGIIHLTDSEHLQIADNYIVDNNLSPACAIALGNTTGLVVRGNHIDGNGVPKENSLQFGIFAPGAASSSEDGKTVDAWPSLDVSGNRIRTEFGPALFADGFGRMRITGNTLTRLGLNQAEPQLASTVVIHNAGLDEFKSPIANFSRLSGNYEIFASGKATADSPLQGGEVLFALNQCTLIVNKRPGSDRAASVEIETLDDLGFHSNQLRCQLIQDLKIEANVRLAGSTVRVTDNRFIETPLMTFRFSCIAKADMLTVTGNQSTHCLDLNGSLTAINLNLIRPQMSQLDCAKVNFPDKPQTQAQTAIALAYNPPPESIVAALEPVAARADRLSALVKAEADPVRKLQLQFQESTALSLKDSAAVLDKAAPADPNAFTIQVNVSRADGKSTKGYIASITDASGKLKDRVAPRPVGDQGTAVFVLPAGEFPTFVKDSHTIFVHVNDAKGAEVFSHTSGVSFEPGKVAIVLAAM